MNKCDKRENSKIRCGKMTKNIGTRNVAHDVVCSELSFIRRRERKQRNENEKRSFVSLNYSLIYFISFHFIPSFFFLVPFLAHQIISFSSTLTTKTGCIRLNSIFFSAGYGFVSVHGCYTINRECGMKRIRGEQEQQYQQNIHYKAGTKLNNDERSLFFFLQNSSMFLCACCWPPQLFEG